MKLENVVPWGRSFDEYRSMFNLSGHDLKKRILGCGDGPASFNAEMSEKGGTVVSIDPIYGFTPDQIRSRIHDVYPLIMEQVRAKPGSYVWNTIRDPDHLSDIRMKAMDAFLADFEKGKKEGRYIEGGLPDLPFEDGTFDLALCSHFLFLYSEQVDLEQHILGMKELCRVASEVRVYPLIALDGNLSPHIEAACDALRQSGIRVIREKVGYEFQKGAVEMILAALE